MNTSQLPDRKHYPFFALTICCHHVYFSVIANIFYLWLKQILDTCSLCTHRSLTMSPMFFLSLAFSAACSTAVAEECNAMLQTDLRSANGMMSRLDFKHALEEGPGHPWSFTYWDGAKNRSKHRAHIFSGMNIHLPAILMFTRGIGF